MAADDPHSGVCSRKPRSVCHRHLHRATNCSIGMGIVSQGTNPGGWYQALFQENLPPDAQCSTNIMPFWTTTQNTFASSATRFALTVA